jgi:hypothetical protein
MRASECQCFLLIWQMRFSFSNGWSALEEMEGWRGSLPIAAPPFFKFEALHVREEILRL